MLVIGDMLEEPLCDDEYEYYTDEDEADIEDEVVAAIISPLPFSALEICTN